MANERLYGVCGFPLKQSLSPFLHGWALRENGLPGSYGLWETSPEKLAAFVRAVRQTPYAGASVTIPHKEAVIPFLDGVSDGAKTIGAVNTLYWKGEKLLGHNTDLEGFLAPTEETPPPETALILGAGGAARAVLAGLASLKVRRVFIAARRRAQAERLAEFFSPLLPSVEVAPWETRNDAIKDAADFWLVNATPVGMRGKAEGESPMSADAFRSAAAPERCLAYDLVYNPPQTAFLVAAREAGWPCRDGLAMFAAQAAAQFHLWTGRRMDVAKAGALLAERLEL